jgi:hypothetical protein
MVTDATPWIEVGPKHYQCSVGGLVDVQVMPRGSMPVAPLEGTCESVGGTYGRTGPDEDHDTYLQSCKDEAVRQASSVAMRLKAAAYDREHDKRILTRGHLHGLVDEQMLPRVHLDEDGLWVGTNDGEFSLYRPTLGNFVTLCRVLNIELKEPQQ